MKRLYLFLALVAMITITACGGPKTPSEVAVKSLKLVVDGDFDDFLKLTNLTDEEKKEFLEDYSSDAKENIEMMKSETGGVDSIVALEENIDDEGTSCSVEIKITLKNGTEFTNKVKLIKVDDRWCLRNPERLIM